MRYIVDAVAISNVKIDVEADSEEGAIEAAKAGGGNVLTLTFDRFHPDTEFEVTEVPYQCIVDAMDLRQDVLPFIDRIKADRTLPKNQVVQRAVEAYTKLKLATGEYDRLVTTWSPEASTDTLEALRLTLHDAAKECGINLGLELTSFS